MKIYSKYGATDVESPEYGTFEADAEGAVDVPEELANFLLIQHINGDTAWETEGGRRDRLVAEEHKRRSDPAYLATIVEELSAKLAAQSAPKRPVKKAEPVADAPVDAPVKKTSTTK